MPFRGTELMLMTTQENAGHNNLEYSCEHKSDYSNFLLDFLVFVFFVFHVELLKKQNFVVFLFQT